jgi:hypothetical protein
MAYFMLEKMEEEEQEKNKPKVAEEIEDDELEPKVRRGRRGHIT